MAGLVVYNEVKRAWKQMATCIHDLGSVYALQSEYDLACIYNMVTSHLYSLCLHDVSVVILCTFHLFHFIYFTFHWSYTDVEHCTTVQLRTVLLVELSQLYFLMFGHALLYRALVIQRKFTRQAMGSKAVCHMLRGFHSGDDSCYGTLDCHSVVDMHQQYVPEDRGSMCLWNRGMCLPHDCSVW